ncbi:MAG: type II secretion system protein [Candidatus Portnoybacteria bacterium]|nr:type II secretion system protein [Candidatus Portnoybacteria bacterium]MDD4982753.1 type II secretion system protein [Candidatus Portnoybacteria bacterium]
MKKFTEIKIKPRPELGIGLIEILVVVSIIGLSLVSLTGLGNFALKIQTRLKQNAVAANLASEALEAARSIRDGGWSDLANMTVDAPFHPAKNPSLYQWTMASGEETIGGFTRRLTISNVFRDSGFNIVESGGTQDAGTKKITAAVSWSYNGQNLQIILVDYLTNWKP